MSEPRALPAPVDDLRGHLPASEPERHVTDWGRSERVEGLMDRTVVDFLYHYWFRCDVEGTENVPAAGGALPYRYEREVEEFLRYSPSVRQGADTRVLADYTPAQLAELARVLEAVAGERGDANAAPGRMPRVDGGD